MANTPIRPGWNRTVVEFAQDINEQECDATAYSGGVRMHFNGWAIFLLTDGTWFPEDTTG